MRCFDSLSCLVALTLVSSVCAQDSSSRWTVKSFGEELIASQIRIEADLLVDGPAKLMVRNSFPGGNIAILASSQSASMSLWGGRTLLVGNDAQVQLARADEYGRFGAAFELGAPVSSPIFVQLVAWETGRPFDLRLSRGFMIYPTEGLYVGPQCGSQLVSTDSVPPQYSVHTSFKVPTSGYSVRQDAIRIVDGDRQITEVLITLSAPSDKETVLAMAETKSIAVELGANPGDEVHVLVSLTKRNVHYPVEPPHRLASKLTVRSVSTSSAVTGHLVKSQSGGYKAQLGFTVPTTGYGLRYDTIRRLETAPPVTEVLLTLIAPADNEMVLPATEKKSIALDLGSNPGREVRVLVSRIQKGAHYIVTPPHELALTLLVN